MAEDWLTDVRKYVADADEAVVAAIVRYLGIALRNRDSSLVSFSDSKETDRVREKFLKKKLALTDPDSVLDSAIAAVGERMKADRTKNRVTVYYLLAEHFGKLGLFGGSATAATAVHAVSPPPASAEPPPAPVEAAPPAPAASPVDAGAALAGGTVAAAVGGAASAAPAAASVTPAAASATPTRLSDTTSASGDRGGAAGSGYSDDDGGGGLGWLPWLLLALLAAALLFFGLRYCGQGPAAGTDNLSVDMNASAPATDLNAGVDANGLDANSVDANVAAAAPAIPEGSGVVAGTRDARPMLTVYFETGGSEVSNDLAAASSVLRDYLAANPGARLSVSGFNDPTGNAALNAELSRNRAQNVAAALAAAGVPQASIDLDRPADTTGSNTDYAGARRVEVTIKQ